MAETNPISSSNPLAQYSQYGYNTDVSNGYAPTAFDSYSQDIENRWNEYNQGKWDILGLKKKRWIENQKAIHAQYQKAYDTAYNNETNTTQRQIDAGYNPNFQGGSAGSPVSTNNPIDNYSPLDSQIQSLQSQYSFGSLINDSINSFMGMAQNLANIKKTNAETEFIKDSSPVKVSNLREEGIGKWLDNNAEHFRQFPQFTNNGDGVPFSVVGSGGYSLPEDDSMLSYQNEIQKYLKDKAQSLNDNKYWDNMAHIMDYRQKMYHFDAEKAVKFEKYLDTHVIPNIVNGIELDNKQIEIDLKTLELGTATKYGSQIINLLKDLVGLRNSVRSGGTKFYGTLR